ncbi:cytochrome P450 [Dendrothele bispora CBS 962.96]|uniref:Cytochrome P450 n=1 Tax=Dendrothele bispora (strain CBS 962.96) TaxID=1314807 RepID=A0A4S8MLE8_DENBC|nr:cytochrome P450 [Dendrothele bispora CBS 962.96]
MSTKITPFLAVAILFGFYHLYISLLRLFRPRLPYPPGPRGYPLIGDLFNAISNTHKGSKDINQHEWARYLEMGRKYSSDIIHVNVLGDHTLILNSAKAATELLEKRSGLYSDRPRLYMMSDLCGWHWNLATMPYSNKWRLHRRIFHQDFQAKAVSTYHPFILQATSNFLRKLVPIEYDPLHAPEIEHVDLESYVRDHAGSIILRVVYGITAQEDLNDYVRLAYLASESLIATMNHGSFFVDYLPWLKFIPAWFPGASFKQKANTWAPMVSDLANGPWKTLKSSMANGTALPCFATKNMEKFNLSNLDINSIENSNNLNSEPDMEEVIKNCSAIAYFGGSDTTVSLVMSSILALSHHPEVLKKAHEELDRVVGPSRLPEIGDRDELPYIDAIIKEVERIYPVTPLGVPHRVISDDVYEGYFIPKGTTVVPNVEAILHSEELYQDPLKFNPDRFLRNDKDSELPPNPELFSFGFGRRICPGRHFALDTAWVLIACLLATCDVTRPLEESQKGCRTPDPVLDYFDGEIAHPKPYKCRIVPRSITALNLMKAGYPSEN